MSLNAAPPAREAVERAIRHVQSRQQRIKEARNDFTAYKRYVWRRYKHAAHLEMIDRKVSEVVRYVETGGAEGIGRLMIWVPPRHGKSQTVARLLPPWFMGRNPDMRVIQASYGASLSEKHSRFVRDLMKSAPHLDVFPGVSPSRDSGARDAWDLRPPHEGGMDAVGKGGAITGKGANLIIADDLVKSRSEAESLTIRNNDWEWWKDDLLTRLEPGGGIILINCMAGDTPVLMADGTERPLASIRPGDQVATYDDGVLRTAMVQKHKSNGPDCIFKITTISGRVVRANKRHPFLVEENGQLRWTRLENLSTGHRIVTLRDKRASGQALPAPGRAAINPPNVGDIARPIITKSGGQTGTAPHPSIQRPSGPGTSNTGTASPLPSMMQWLRRKVASVLSAGSRQTLMPATAGTENCTLTTTTTPMQSGAFSATAVTSQRALSEQRQTPWPLSDTSDFTAEAIVSIEPDGVEEVFDVQIEGTENFLANGLVSHNTRWHEDDVAGRIALNEPNAWEFLVLPALALENDPLGRLEGEPLWPERFSRSALERARRTMGEYSFEALYQQNPRPRDGGLFRRSAIAEHILNDPPADIVRRVRYWDLAMSDKKTADYTCGVLMGYTSNGNLVVLDVVRVQVDWSAVPSVISEVMLKDGPSVPQGIEGAFYQSQMTSTLLRMPALMRHSIRAFPVETDKWQRALPWSARWGAGQVYLLRRTWTSAFIDEHISFPQGVHDDQVDASSGALNALAGAMRPVTVVKKRMMA
jgi:predicted phage terminase large subunit-like protein